jgi:hypothetical protein
MKKIIVLMCGLFFLNALITPQTIGHEYSLNSDEDGRLSGHISDIDEKPLANAMINISCGNNFFICYSNENGYYLQENIPIVFCVWNITAQKEGYQPAYCEMPIGVNSFCNFTLLQSTVISLEVTILSGLSFPSPLILIRNDGNVPVHSIEITDVFIEGNVIYNNRNSAVASSIEPDDQIITTANSWFIGLGPFIIKVTVECDEGIFSSNEINGLIVGPFIFIP